MDSQELRYLDAIEDARYKYNQYRAVLKWVMVALVVCIGAVLLGAALDLGGLSTALCVIGGVGSFVGLLFGGIWLTVHLDSGESPIQALRKAEREHRNFLMRQADGR